MGLQIRIEQRLHQFIVRHAQTILINAGTRTQLISESLWFRYEYAYAVEIMTLKTSNRLKLHLYLCILIFGRRSSLLFQYTILIKENEWIYKQSILFLYSLRWNNSPLLNILLYITITSVAIQSIPKNRLTSKKFTCVRRRNFFFFEARNTARFHFLFENVHVTRQSSFAMCTWLYGLYSDSAVRLIKDRSIVNIYYFIERHTCVFIKCSCSKYY